MLKEHRSVRQHAGESFRRLFWDEFLQLYVWFDESKQIVGFELVYDLADDYRAFRWRTDQGIEHYRVDDGESRAMKKAAPVLRMDRSAIEPGILAEYMARSEYLEPEITHLVTEKLQDFLTSFASERSDGTDA